MKTVADREAVLVETARAVIARQLRALRSDEQGGYMFYLGDGHWSGGVLGATSDSEINALFAFARITPDVIESLGECTTCEFSRPSAMGGVERGYERPCVSCMRPKMSNYRPLPGARATFACVKKKTECTNGGIHFVGMRLGERMPRQCYFCGGQVRRVRE